MAREVQGREEEHVAAPDPHSALRTLQLVHAHLPPASYCTVTANAYTRVHSAAVMQTRVQQGSGPGYC